MKNEIYLPYLSQNLLPAKVNEICYLIENNGKLKRLTTMKKSNKPLAVDYLTEQAVNSVVASFVK